MRKKVIAGNWKMNKDIPETTLLIRDIVNNLRNINNKVDVVICPPFTSLSEAKSLLDKTQIKLGAQNMNDKENGAFTGEISAQMLISIGCEYVILGHSERRQYLNETNLFINSKIKQALKYRLTPIVCVGETLKDRESGITEQIVTQQVKGVLEELSSSDVEEVIIAYEPVWAIGTGKNATPQQANEVHQLIRKLVGQLYPGSVAEKLVIQYGGSVNATNAKELLSQSDIDGALIGGASLHASTFAAIVRAGIEAS